jgi:hypothetical protein
MAMHRYGRCCALVVATALVACTAACGAGRHAPPTPPVPVPASPLAGITATAADHSVVMRELYVAPATIRAGASATLSFQLWNNTAGTISLTGATASPGGAAVLNGDGEPSTRFAVPVPGGGHIALSAGASRYLEIRCLPHDLRSGDALTVTFVFSNSARITADVPVGPIAGTAGPIRSASQAVGVCTPSGSR